MLTSSPSPHSQYGTLEHPGYPGHNSAQTPNGRLVNEHLDTISSFPECRHSKLPELHQNE